MMTREAEHTVRLWVLRGRNLFCACCGDYLPRRSGSTLCPACGAWANRAILRAQRLALRRSFAMIDGGRA